MPHMKWPPQIKSLDVIGEIKDVSGRHYPRDVGRPVYLGGNTYYLFGDTFCHNEHKNFVGVSNNTIAYVPDPRQKPLYCDYQIPKAYQPSFIPHTKSEEDYENDPKHKQAIDRVVNWSFGGIIEDAPDSATGWVFYEKMLSHGATAGKFFGMAVARVEAQPNKSIKVDRLMGDEMLFGPDEPHFGTVTHFHGIDGYVYLLGPKDDKPPTLNLKNHWTRIRRDADFTKRSNYEFMLKGPQGPTWSSTYEFDQLVDVIPAQAQGAIIYDAALGPEGRPYLWFGVNKFGGNVLYIACAPALEGPWEEWGGPEIPKWGGGGLRYCLYPHERHCATDEGEMMLSWSDDGKQLGGMVVLASLKLALEGEDVWTSHNQGSSQQQQPMMNQGEHDRRSSGGWKDKAKGLLHSFSK